MSKTSVSSFSPKGLELSLTGTSAQSNSHRKRMFWFFPPPPCVFNNYYGLEDAQNAPTSARNTSDFHTNPWEGRDCGL